MVQVKLFLVTLALPLGTHTSDLVAYKVPGKADDRPSPRPLSPRGSLGFRLSQSWSL